jgi:hypothetical protein
MFFHVRDWLLHTDPCDEHYQSLILTLHQTMAGIDCDLPETCKTGHQ